MKLSAFSPETTYVAPATLLPADLCRQASCAGLCYVQLVASAREDDSALVRVAALPHRLNDVTSTRVFSLSLVRGQLAQLLPWDRTLQGMPTCDAREVVEAHARQSCPLPPSVSTDVAGTRPAPSLPQAIAVGETCTRQIEVFVSCETVEQAMRELPNLKDKARASTHPSRMRAFLQFGWVHAVLCMLARQLQQQVQTHSQLYTYLKRLDTVARSVWVALYHTRPPLVSARPAYCGERQVGWHVLMGLAA